MSKRSDKLANEIVRENFVNDLVDSWHPDFVAAHDALLAALGIPE